MTGPDGTRVAGSPTDPWVRVLAPNPGPMTLDGTNTWVLHQPGTSAAIVVDPGPADEGHLHAVLDVVRRRGARVGVVLLTHRHADHIEGAARFAALADAPVRAFDPALVVDAPPLVDGECVAATDGDGPGGVEVRVVAVPGHTTDSVAFHVPAARVVLTGDTVLGRGTSVIAHPDGALAAYLRSLRRLRALVVEAAVERLLPGHGPVVDRPVEVLDGYLAHRAERLDQVRAALGDGAETPRDVVARVYADVDRALWPAAERSVRAQLDYLRERREA